jgi:hypothetical protein
MIINKFIFLTLKSGNLVSINFTMSYLKIKSTELVAFLYHGLKVHAESENC